ncbi:ExeA family protein [Aromatoleum petrolei]|uniref:AAA family ATPase n=1 Tax=Aromatoleum petrolei TaxID=76116 RepID=A0ABX1MXA8_9RHOO|nr:ExeA family protein [Aromatoleum petrolei]NMF91198.1 AAA family ATPase [Aromatoleum petrolei]QTQ35456.1 Putative general secretion pathway protein [Aromatoleum petrolei]
MYNEYFGFSAAPFSIAPDPRYLFMSERHREALAHLLYGLRVDGGFVLLTGEVGTGKTTICRCLLEQVPDGCDIAFILNPKLDTLELLATLCDELHVPVAGAEHSVKVLVDRINRHLLDANARGRKTVLIVDEAQNLSNEVLEQLRLLTNLETNERKLLQIILLGQPELRERLAQPELRQLAQRIVARYHLEPLSRQEVGAYVNHRLAVAGGQQRLFPDAVIDRLYRLSGGTPRLINVICDRALLGAYVEGKTSVVRSTLDKAAGEVLGSVPRASAARRIALASALGIALAGGAAAAWHYGLAVPASGTTTPVAAAPAAPEPAPVAKASVAGSTDAGAQPVTIAAEPAATTPEKPIAWPKPEEHWLHEVMAVRSLFALWGLDARLLGIDDACRLAARRDLGCLRREGGLDELRAMNAPAIVELRQADGPNFLATLLGIDGERARIAFAGDTHDVSLDTLQRQWHGNYTLLWRTPPGWHRTVGTGMRGSDVVWVVRQLARWEGLTEPEASPRTYTAQVEERMRAFQRSNGLPEDGVVGPLTVVRLAVLSEPDTPVLTKQAR